MTKHLRLFSFIIFFVFIFILIVILNINPKNNKIPAPSTENINNQEQNFPMSIESLRKRDYPKSNIVIEETLKSGFNYKRFIASYKSDGLKIYGLLTIPTTPLPEKGYPTIIFLHGFIAPQTYITTKDYIASQDSLAQNGFITFKPDLRGHGKSEGEATGAHFSEAYVVDTLNAVSALKIYKNVDPQRIGIWGHSNGGEIGLRTMVVSSDIKAGVFWAGVVGSFQDMLETYNSKIPFMRRTPELVEKYGSPSANPSFWNKIDPYSYLENISGPIQIHHGTADPQVPIELSIHLKNELEKLKKTVEFYEYIGADHNFNGQYFNSAMQRSIDFFKTHL